MAVMFAHLQEPPPSATALRPDLPPAVDEVLAGAMAKSPDDRFATCGEFATALRSSLGVVPWNDAYSVTGAVEPTAESQLARSATVSSALTDLPSRTATVLRPRVGSQARHRPARRGSRRAVIVAAAALVLVAGPTTAYVVTSDHGSDPGHLPVTGTGSSSPRDTATVSVTASASAPAPAAPSGPPPTKLNSTAGDAGYILAFRGDKYLVSLEAGDGVATPALVSTWNLSSPHAAPSQFQTQVGDNALSINGSLAYGTAAANNPALGYVWDTASGRKIATLPQSLNSAAPISDTGVLAFTGPTGVTLWNTNSGTGAGLLPYPSSVVQGNITTSAISPDGTTVALTTDKGTIYVYDTRTAAITVTFNIPPWGNSSEFSADGSTLAIQAGSMTNPGVTYVCSLASKSLAGTLHNFLALSANGKLAAVSAGSDINLVDLASGKVVRTLPEPSGMASPNTAAFSSDDTRLAVGDGNADYIWNLAG